MDRQSRENEKIFFLMIQIQRELQRSFGLLWTRVAVQQQSVLVLAFFWLFFMANANPPTPIVQGCCGLKVSDSDKTLISIVQEKLGLSMKSINAICDLWQNMPFKVGRKSTT